ncbi:MAG TPA: dTDP-4-dehydrorhamnose reductase [Candidatus Binatia bacterium]|nr:dTDP-4-dehydrorhamnose reductase [Candidatus Binatia bacterium]
MKVLVTGAAGQLGALLPEALAGHEVVALARDRLDVTNLTQVRLAVQSERPHAVVNAAAYNRVDDAEADPEAAYRGNALGPRNLALATADAGIALVHVSSDYVFDGTATRPYHEYDRPSPTSVYGASKLAGEIAVRELNPRHFVVRTAWVYAARHRNFPHTMLELAASRPEVRVVNDQTGSPTYAPHLARALVRLLATGAFGTYHLAGAGGTSWYELTCELYRRLGVATPVVPVTTAEFPRPAKRPAYSVLTSIQDPRIELPAWQEGLADFCRRVARS